MDLLINTRVERKNITTFENQTTYTQCSMLKYLAITEVQTLRLLTYFLYKLLLTSRTNQSFSSV